MPKYIYFFISFFSFYASKAQNVAPKQIVSTCFGGSNTDFAKCIKPAKDGGYIIIANTNSNDGDIDTGFGESDIWVAKLDSWYNIEWKKTYGGSLGEEAFSIFQSKDGGYIIMASSLSTDGQVTGYHPPTPTTNGAGDAWIVKIDSKGNIQWEKCWGGANSDYILNGIETTDGGFAFIGATASIDGDVLGKPGHAGNIDFWVVKLNQQGSLLWQHNYGSTYDDEDGYDLIETENEGLLLCGSTNSVNGLSIGNHGKADALVIQIDKMGNVLWHKCFGGSGADAFEKIIKNKNGGFLLLGGSDSNDGDVAGNHTKTGQQPESDVWIVSIDKKGYMLWQRCYGGSNGETAYSIDTRQQDGGYVIAAATESFDGDITNNKFLNAWVFAISETGSIIWQSCYGGIYGSRIFSIIFTTDGGFLGAGIAYDDVCHTHKPPYGDIWLFKCGYPQFIHIENSNTLSLYPNPAHNTLGIITRNVKQVNIYNILGQMVLTKVLINYVGNYFSSNINSLNSGTYIVETIDAIGNKLTAKLLVL